MEDQTTTSAIPIFGTPDLLLLSFDLRTEPGEAFAPRDDLVVEGSVGLLAAATLDERARVHRPEADCLDQRDHFALCGFVVSGNENRMTVVERQIRPAARLEVLEVDGIERLDDARARQP